MTDQESQKDFCTAKGSIAYSKRKYSVQQKEVSCTAKGSTIENIGITEGGFIQQKEVDRKTKVYGRYLYTGLWNVSNKNKPNLQDMRVLIGVLNIAQGDNGREVIITPTRLAEIVGFTMSERYERLEESLEIWQGIGYVSYTWQIARKNPISVTISQDFWEKNSSKQGLYIPVKYYYMPAKVSRLAEIIYSRMAHSKKEKNTSKYWKIGTRKFLEIYGVSPKNPRRAKIELRKAVEKLPFLEKITEEKGKEDRILVFHATCKFTCRPFRDIQDAHCEKPEGELNIPKVVHSQISTLQNAPRQASGSELQSTEVPVSTANCEPVAEFDRSLSGEDQPAVVEVPANVEAADSILEDKTDEVEETMSELHEQRVTEQSKDDTPGGGSGRFDFQKLDNDVQQNLSQIHQKIAAERAANAEAVAKYLAKRGYDIEKIEQKKAEQREICKPGASKKEIDALRQEIFQKQADLAKKQAQKLPPQVGRMAFSNFDMPDTPKGEPAKQDTYIKLEEVLSRREGVDDHYKPQPGEFPLYAENKEDIWAVFPPDWDEAKPAVLQCIQYHQNGLDVALAALRYAWKAFPSLRSQGVEFNPAMKIANYIRFNEKPLQELDFARERKRQRKEESKDAWERQLKEREETAKMKAEREIADSQKEDFWRAVEEIPEEQKTQLWTQAEEKPYDTVIEYGWLCYGYINGHGRFSDKLKIDFPFMRSLPKPELEVCSE